MMEMEMRMGMAMGMGIKMEIAWVLLMMLTMMLTMVLLMVLWRKRTEVLAEELSLHPCDGQTRTAAAVAAERGVVAAVGVGGGRCGRRAIDQACAAPAAVHWAEPV